MRIIAVLIATLALLATTTRAVIVAGIDGTINTTAPGDDPGWANVGKIGGTTGVYLGDYGGQYWVLTASHVGAGDIVLPGGTYTAVGGSAIRVLNADNSPADLTLFRISTNPLLPTLTLSSSRPANGSQILSIGNGPDRVNSPNFPGNSLAGWTITAGPTWTEQASGGVDAIGYYEGGTHTMRWGTNNIEGTVVQNYGFGTTSLFTSDFDSTTGESQGAPGDSGGATFFKNGSTWQLVGIMGATGQFTNQPASTAVFGNLTYYADLSIYNSFIVSAIPEPADMAAWCGALAVGFTVWRRHRRA